MKKSFGGKVFCFRQWSRKKHSILLSLSRVIRIGVLCVVYSIIAQTRLAFPQADSLPTSDPYMLREVEITGQRSEVISAEIARMVKVVTRDEIEKSGISSISGLLEYIANIDIRQRGASGVQADASMRGSSFDHVMILVNGINMSDPQTGHFNFDLPVDPESIERIEILEGPASRVLGAGAFMGAVNIITRRGNDEVSFSQAAGQHGYLRTNANGGFSSGAVSGFLSASRSTSSGYMKNTDFNILNVYYRGNLSIEGTRFDFQTGWQNKHFGAAGFYSPRFPDQYEENGTWFSSLKLSTGEKIKISPQIYWRHKKDHFVLIRDNPSFYENFHLNDVFGSKLNITIPGDRFIQNYGFDFRSENILSNNIGLENPQPKRVRGEDSIFYNRQYQRTDLALFAEYILKINKLSITAGFMFDRNTGFKDRISFFPGIDLSYRLGNKSSMFASFNRSLHLPTFTDLFYRDPVNQGNIKLDPNRMVSWEAGFKNTADHYSIKMSLFYNSGKDIIDWVWSYRNNTFRPVNLERYSSKGISTGFTARLDAVTKWLPENVSLNYTFISVDKSTPDSISKYYNLRHKFSGAITQKLLQNMLFTILLSYQDRSGASIIYNQEAGFGQLSYKPYFLIDGNLKWTYRFIQLFAEVTNLLNTQYIDSGSALQPGRWIKGGVIINFPEKDRGIQ